MLENNNVETGEFEELATAVIINQISKSGLSYSEVSERLKQIGVSETEGSLEFKINRGCFSAAFLFQVMVVIGAKELRLV